MKPGYRRFLVPGLSTLTMMFVLIGLGTWQVYRLHWKEGMLARIAAAEAEPPVPLTQDPAPYTSAPYTPAPYTPAPYTKVSVTGHFLFDRAATFGADVRDTRTGPVLGFYQIVPLERQHAPPLLVDRGWIPRNREASLDDPGGVVTVTGYIRPAERTRWFSAEDDVAARQFFTLDPQAIGAAVGISVVAPFTLVALGSQSALTYPTPAQHLPQPPNNHLSYVLTWYGLAAALAVIFCVWARKASLS